MHHTNTKPIQKDSFAHSRKATWTIEKSHTFNQIHSSHFSSSTFKAYTSFHTKSNKLTFNTSLDHTYRSIHIQHLLSFYHASCVNSTEKTTTSHTRFINNSMAASMYLHSTCNKCITISSLQEANVHCQWSMWFKKHSKSNMFQLVEISAETV